MSEINDGGPAFPNYIGHPGCLENEGCRVAPGLSLRDYFAAQALAGICARLGLNASSKDGLAAIAAYDISDAMLAARRTPPKEGPGK